MNKQTEILMEQTKANSWPNLSFRMERSISNNEVDSYGFIIVNSGTGPAIIENTIITYNGLPVQNWMEFYEAINVPDSINLSYANLPLIDTVIKANEDFNLIDWSINKRLMNFIYQKADKIKIQICYKSVYGDYWTIEREGFKSNLERVIRKETNSCKSTKTKSFLE
jgi:hypothetical protein